MDFSAALTIVKDGGLVCRYSWKLARAWLSVESTMVWFNWSPHGHVPYIAGPGDLLADDWHMVKPEEVGLDPSDSGKILHGDEVNAVPLPTKVVPIKGS